MKKVTDEDKLFKEKLYRIYEGTKTKTQKQLAEVLGIKQSTVSTMQSKHSIPDSWLISLLDIYGLNPQWVLNAVEPKYLIHSSQAKKSHTVTDFSSAQQSEKLSQELKEADSSLTGKRFPLYSTKYTGETNSKQEKLFEVEKYITLPINFANEFTRIFRYQSKSMAPTILQNATIAIDTSSKELINGEVYAFCLPSQGVLLSRIFHSATNATLEEQLVDLTSDNKNFPTATSYWRDISEHLIGKLSWTINFFN